MNKTVTLDMYKGTQIEEGFEKGGPGSGRHKGSGGKSLSVPYNQKDFEGRGGDANSPKDTGFRNFPKDHPYHEAGKLNNIMIHKYGKKARYMLTQTEEGSAAIDNYGLKGDHKKIIEQALSIMPEAGRSLSREDKAVKRRENSGVKPNKNDATEGNYKYK